MAHFDDISDYHYVAEAMRPGTKNVGWLGKGQAFDKGESSDDLLDTLWQFCAISMVQTRGLHICEFCSDDESGICERDGSKLLLGSAEIRVFSLEGDIYAAPNLIYHYVQAHQYKPPVQFVEALKLGPKPPNSAYFDRLKQLGFEWSKTLAPQPNAGRIRLDLRQK